FFFFFFQAEDGIRDLTVTGVQTCALPISCCHREAGGGSPAVALEIRHLPLDDIKPSPENPRRHFDVEGLNELAASLRVHGVLEPILVRPVDLRDWEAKLAAGKKVPMEIVAGERRWRAAAIA